MSSKRRAIECSNLSKPESKGSVTWKRYRRRCSIAPSMEFFSDPPVSPRDHHVIKEPYPYSGSGPRELSAGTSVIAAWGWISRRMIVCNSKSPAVVAKDSVQDLANRDH